MTTPRRQFTPEFKLEAVRLVIARGLPRAQVARELGVRSDVLRAWKRKVASGTGQSAAAIFPGSGVLPEQEDELRRLRRENELLTQERDFLKKHHDRRGHHHQMKMPLLRHGPWQQAEVEQLGAVSSQKS